MSRTATAPATDRRLWRLLLARMHPDAGGSDELFVWAQGLREALDDGATEPRACGRCRSAAGPDAEEPERIPFDADLNPVTLTSRALSLIDELDHPYRAALRLLANYDPAGRGRSQLQERRGATYRQLAAIAHAAGMGYSERLKWYRVAASVPLSQRHAGHILSRLKGEG